MLVDGLGIRFHHPSSQGAQQTDACRQGPGYQCHTQVPILQMPVSEICSCRHTHYDQSV